MDILWLCLIFGLLGGVCGTLNGNCDVEEVTAEQWLTEYTNDEVNDDETKEFKRFKVTNVADVKMSEGIYHKYFSVKHENDVVIISPTEEFKNIEANENSASRPLVIIANLIFTCTEGNGALAFYQPIKDLNTYTPQFKQSSYSYRLPMPLPANIDMSCFFEVPIVACDADITNTEVTFGIIPSEDFSIVWQEATDTSNKCHRALVKTAQALSLTESKGYLLSVADTGNPTRGSQAQFRIEVNHEQSIPKNPQFQSAYYTGTYDDEKDTHAVKFDSEIALKRKNFLATYALEGEYKEHFDIKSTNNGVAVTLKTNFPEDVLRENVIVLLTVEAKIDQAEDTGRTVLVIYLPKKITTTPAPTTCPECPLCTTEASTSSGSTECATCKPCPTTSCPPCSTTESPQFSTTKNPNTECPVTECPPCSSTPYPVCPPCTECPPTECPALSTTAPVECPSTCKPCTECPSTESPPTSSPPWPECPTTCKPCTACPSTEIPATSTWPECPTTCKPCTACPSTEIPATSTCPECPITPTECPPCASTPVPPIPTIMFEQKTYVFTIPPIESTTVGIVRANSNTQEAVKYTIHPFEGSTIPKQLTLSESSGRLTVEEKLTIGTYKIKIQAEGVASKVTDITDVEINVVTEAATTYSVIVKEINELSEAVISLPCEETIVCTYEFDYQYPETNPPLFTMENGNLKSGRIDLQMDQIKDLLVPQFTVNLKLRPSAPTTRNSTFVRALNGDAEESRQWIWLPTHLRRESDSLLVSIIINDINNHPPVFQEGKKLMVGYPVQKLVHELHPPYLAQVKATDLDRFPLNADIRYSTTSPNFIVHPVSGTIYPDKSPLGGETFDVIATDRAGGNDGLSATLQIEVVPLSNDHLTLLNVAGKVLEDIEEVISSLSDKSNMQIRYLKASTVYPPFNAGRKLLNLLTFGATRSESSHSLSIVIYAFDSNNEIIPAEKVQSNLNGTENILVESWKPTMEDQEDVEPVNTTGYIAAIVVLSVILLVLLVGISLLYFFKIRRFSKRAQPYRNLTNIDNKTTKSDDNPSEGLPKARSAGYAFNPPPPEDNDTYSNENNGYIDVLDSERSSVQPPKRTNENKLDNLVSQPDQKRDSISAQLLKKINEMARKDAQSENSTSDYDELKDQKKSVSFKPTVQKINILVDDEKQDNDIGKKVYPDLSKVE